MWSGERAFMRRFFCGVLHHLGNRNLRYNILAGELLTGYRGEKPVPMAVLRCIRKTSPK